MANNDDQIPDDLPDFEQESDFSEFEDPKDGAGEVSISSTLKNNPLVKLGLVAAGLIVVIGGVMMFGGTETKTPDSYVGGANELKETPGTKELTPVMQEAMEEYNDQRIQEAVNQGGSVMPVPIEPPKTFLPVPTDAAANEDPLQRWRQMQEERLRVQREQEQIQAQMGQAQQADPAVEQAQQALANAMSTQMTQILSEKDAKPLTFMQISTLEEENGAEGDGTGVSGGTGGIGPDGQPLNKEPLEIVIPAGTIVYAQLLNEANSDVEGPIVALIAQGPFSGSRALGTFQKREELLVLQFTTLISKEGFSIPITAYAMDPNTTLIGMATEVDHRYWKRVILPAAAEFVQGVGEAIAEKGTTTVTVNDGDSTTSTQDNTDIDTEQELSKGVERAFDKVGEILDDEGSATEILVVVKAGTPLGILFMEPVTKQSIDDAKYGRAAGNQPGVNQQPGQQYNPMFNMMGANQQMNGQDQYGNNSGYGGLSQSIMQGLQNQQSIQSGAQ